MELRPLPEPAAKTIGIMLAVLTAPVWAALVALLWLDDRMRPHIPSGDRWAAWFAWHPVTLDHGFGKTVWLETIERQHWYGRTIYRRQETP